MPSPVTNPLRSLAMISATDGWAVGDNGVTLHWGGDAWTKIASPVSPTTGLNSVAMVSDTDGWAVGRSDVPDSGTILHWDGRVWTQVFSPSSNWLSSVTMIPSSSGGGVSAMDGWIVGRYGTILRYAPFVSRLYLPVAFK